MIKPYALLLFTLGIVSPTNMAIAAPTSTPVIGPATLEQLTVLEVFQKRLISAGQMHGAVKRKTVIGLLGQEKVATGEFLFSKGRVKLDLTVSETQERQLLLVGEKNFWAVTYPGKAVKGAAIQVVKGSAQSKKASQGFMALLGKHGFLKSFTVSGVALENDGGIRYYLQPKADWIEARRALVALSPEVKAEKGLNERTLREIQIWDFQDNETSFRFEELKTEARLAKASTFDFIPPKDADVMTVQ